MQEAETPASTQALVETLAEQMAQGNLALTLFDGASFARHAAAEERLCLALRDGHAPTPNFPWLQAPVLQQVLNIRRALLASTQRTVRALWGACCITADTYSLANRGHGAKHV